MPAARISARSRQAARAAGRTVSRLSERLIHLRCSREDSPPGSWLSSHPDTSVRSGYSETKFVDRYGTYTENEKSTTKIVSMIINMII